MTPIVEIAEERSAPGERLTTPPSPVKNEPTLARNNDILTVEITSQHGDFSFRLTSR